MDELNEVKQGWVSFSDAATIAEISRPSVYYYVDKNPDDIRTRYVKARRQIRIEDLLVVLGKADLLAASGNDSTESH